MPVYLIFGHKDVVITDTDIGRVGDSKQLSPLYQLFNRRYIQLNDITLLNNVYGNVIRECTADEYGAMDYYNPSPVNVYHLWRLYVIRHGFQRKTIQRS